MNIKYIMVKIPNIIGKMRLVIASRSETCQVVMDLIIITKEKIGGPINGIETQINKREIMPKISSRVKDVL